LGWANNPPARSSADTPAVIFQCVMILLLPRQADLTVGQTISRWDRRSPGGTDDRFSSSVGSYTSLVFNMVYECGGNRYRSLRPSDAADRSTVFTVVLP